MEAKATPASPNKPPAARRWIRRVLLLAGPIVLLLGGAYFYLKGGRYVTSDDAYVRADKLTVTSEVPGTVVAVAVHDNDHVAAGQLLFRLDDTPYRIAVDAAKARIEGVRVELAIMRANYRERLAQIEEAREQVRYAGRELARQQALNAGHVAPEADLDRAQHAADAAGRKVAVLEQDAASVLASLGGSITQPDEQYARFAEAKARLDSVERDLSKTTIHAPIAGTATNVTNLPVGKYLAAAQPAFSLVVNDHRWVEANLKETEVTHVRPGQLVEIEVDTYPNRTWHGVVGAVGPATGAEFALIPPQNASGTWIKVVQRLPVHIDLSDPDAEQLLRAGMSVEVTIDTGHVRTLNELFPGRANAAGE